MKRENLRHNKKDCRNSPFAILSFIHLFFYRFANIQTRHPFPHKYPLALHTASVIIDRLL